MIASYDLGFCQITAYHDYTVAVMNEGITVLPEHNDVFWKMVKKHFGDRPFVYISHRINSYSVNPAVHMESSKIPNLIGLAVVSSDPKQKFLAKVEKTFFEKEFRYFETLKEALKWKDEILKKYKKPK